MRSQFGRHFWWISLFSVFLGQTIFLFAACLSLYAALLNPAPLCFTDAAGATVCALSIWLEAAADMQMDAFQQARREKRTDQTVIARGLWLWSRHPNYLGEMCWWWGLYVFTGTLEPLRYSNAPLKDQRPPVFATASPVFATASLNESRSSSRENSYAIGAPASYSRWLAAGPGAITFLFWAISVKLMEDRQLQAKPEAFRAYMREVPSALMLLPPPVNRAIGGWLHGSAAPVMS